MREVKKFKPPAHIFGPAVQRHLVPEIMKLPKPENNSGGPDGDDLGTKFVTNAQISPE